MDMTLIVITVLALAFAAVMGVVAWRVVREDRRRSEARVAVLAASIHNAELDLRPSTVATPNDLFANQQPSSTAGFRFAVVAALGIFVVGSVAAVAVLAGRGSHRIAEPPAKATAPAPAPARTPPPVETTPLELLALGHDRTADKLTIRGIVRNPSSGSDVEGLMAVVFVFNRNGGFLTSGRALISTATLTPGGEAQFSVSIPDTNDVGRYRVSFRTDERVIPHVDRRDRPAMARVQ